MLIGRKFERAFNCSTRCSPNIIPELDEPERVMRHTNVPSESSYHTERALKEILTQEAKIMGAWTQALKDFDGEED